MKKGNVKEKCIEDKAILKEAMAARGITQKALGERIGMLQTSLSANLRRDRMSLDMFVKLLGGMGYDVAVVDRKDGSVRWIVENEE